MEGSRKGGRRMQSFVGRADDMPMPGMMRGAWRKMWVGCVRAQSTP